MSVSAFCGGSLQRRFDSHPRLFLGSASSRSRRRRRSQRRQLTSFGRPPPPLLPRVVVVSRRRPPSEGRAAFLLRFSDERATSGQWVKVKQKRAAATRVKCRRVASAEKQ